MDSSTVIYFDMQNCKACDELNNFPNFPFGLNGAIDRENCGPQGDDADENSTQDWMQVNFCPVCGKKLCKK